MSDTVASLRRKIESAGDLHSVVRTMKILAATNIGQYEKSARALADYYRLIELGLSVCFRECVPDAPKEEPLTPVEPGPVGAIIFGSDQGLVGQFNDVVVEYALKRLAEMPGKPQVWSVGERVQERLADADLPVVGGFGVPNSVKGITPLVGQLLVETGKHHGLDGVGELHLFFNHTTTASGYEPMGRRVLPLDATWRRDITERPWPTHYLPSVVGSCASTLWALIREYLFVSLFQACAESLASENAARLGAMQRAEKNIDDLLDDLTREFHQLRQSAIDEELFDVISGFEALGKVKAH